MGPDGRDYGVALPPSLQQLQARGPVLLIFLRHFG